MPLLDGIDATVAIREYEAEHNLPEKKIIVFTGNNTEKMKTRAKNAGVNEFLAKPIDRIALSK